MVIFVQRVQNTVTRNCFKQMCCPQLAVDCMGPFPVLHLLILIMFCDTLNFQARLLSYQLTKKPLPGLTSIEQLELLALADTFASAKLDLEESPGSIERGVKFAKKEGN